MNISLKAIIILVSLLFILFLGLFGLGDALIPLLFSFSMAYLIFPLINKLELKGVNRAVSVMTVFLALSSIFVLVSYFVIPSLVSDAASFSKELPSITLKAAEKIEEFSLQIGLDVDLSKENIQAYAKNHRNDIISNFSSKVGLWLKGLFSNTTNWLLGVLNLFLIPLFFFYIINDFEKIISQIKSFIPKPALPKLAHYSELANTVLNGYIRGQLMVALILGLLYSVGLSLVGLKFGLLIGLIAGVISIIPYAGLSIGLFIAMAVGLANYTGVGSLVGIGLVFVFVQALEGTLITPKLVGDKVGLSSLTTMLALIIGGNLLGVAGMILAIPVAAILKSILIELKNELHQLDVYKK